MWRLAPPVLLVAAFVGSRVVFFAAGVRFDDSSLRNYWQYVEVELLRSRLTESVLYLHSQPPLFNLFLGAVLKWCPAPRVAFALVYQSLGLVLALSTFTLMRRLGVGPWLGFAACVALTVSPATILYENWLFYPYLTAVLLVLAGLLLHVALSASRPVLLPACFGCLAAVALMHSLFHLSWLVTSWAGVTWASRERGDARWSAACGALVVVAIAGLVYAKNAYLFGSFSASSWLGMNLSRLTTARLPVDERARLVAAGVLSDLALHGAFRPLDAYGSRWQSTPPTGVPVLDRPLKVGGATNFNHLAYLNISRGYLRDAVWVLRNRPAVYLKAVGSAGMRSLLPTTDYFVLKDLKAPIGRYERLWNRVVFWQPRSLGVAAPAGILSRLGRMPWLIVLSVPLVLVLSLRDGWRWLREDHGDWPRGVTVLFLGFHAVWVLGIGSLVELGENQRFRFSVDPLLLTLAVMLVADAWRDGIGPRTRRLFDRGPVRGAPAGGKATSCVCW